MPTDPGLAPVAPGPEVNANPPGFFNTAKEAVAALEASRPRAVVIHNIGRPIDSMIGRLDRLLSEFLLAAESDELDEADRQTLKHHADDLIGVGQAALKKLGLEVAPPAPAASAQELAVCAAVDLAIKEIRDSEKHDEWDALTLSLLKRRVALHLKCSGDSVRAQLRGNNVVVQALGVDAVARPV